MITADDVRSAREILRMNRAEFAEETGLSVGKISRIETNGPKDEELEFLEDALRAAGVVTDEAISDGKLLVEHDDKGGTISYEWKGLQRGQIVRVHGIVGERFKFAYHYVSPTQEYVGLYAVKNGHERCILPHRIRTSRGRKL